MTDQGEQHVPDIERELLRYLDGEISDHEAERLEGRIEADDRMRELLSQYSSLDRRLAGLRDRRMDEFDEELLRSDIVAALERKVLLEGPSRRSRLLRPRVIVPLAAAAAVVIAASVTITMLRTGPEAPRLRDPMVSASVLPARGAGESPVVESRTLQMEHMQVRLSTESEAGPPDVPAGTVYVSVGPRRTDREAESVYSYPVEWTLREMY